MKILRLMNDQAIGESDEKKEDGLGFENYAKILSESVLGTKGPFTIGIFGEWGTGKTSLMRMIEKDLDENEDVLCVWFNAWRYEKEDHPVVPLVATIIKKIEKNETFLQKLGDKGNSLLKILRAITYAFSSKVKIGIPPGPAFEMSVSGKDATEKLENLFSDPLLNNSLYHETYEALSDLSIERNKKLVVIIDDLDRCFPDMAIKLLESIKLVLCQPNFIFIIGVARKVIEGYLQHRYEKEYGLTNFEGHAYLDKIVQLPFYIPPYEERIKDFSRKLIELIEIEEADVFEEIVPVIGVSCSNNPRAVIRFVNNLLIDKAIYESLSKKNKLQEDISVAYFAISRSLQQHWLEIFTKLTNSDSLCLKIGNWQEEKRSEYIESEDKEEANIATVINADQKLQSILFSSHGIKWLNNVELRKAATQFILTQRHEDEDCSKAEIENILKSHKRWLDSYGKEGKRSTLYKVDLTGAEINDYDLTKAVFAECDLSNAKLNNSDFTQATFNGVNLGNAKLVGAKLIGTKFRNADLTAADLGWCSIKNTDFRSAKLNRVNFTNAIISGSNFSGASLRGATIEKSQLIDSKTDDAVLPDNFET